jgi:hypothetical protein
MSLRIDVNTVFRLLLKDGVGMKYSLDLSLMDAFEWTDTEGLAIPSGDLAAVPAMGVRFKTRASMDGSLVPSRPSRRCIMNPLNLKTPSR